MGVTTSLLLARHGEIQANVERRWHGSTDSELTANGRIQAQLLADHVVREQIAISAIYTSPLLRARQTAAPVAHALELEPVVVPALQEFGIGELENRAYADLAEKDRFYERIGADIHYAPPGGESVAAVAQRMEAAVAEIARGHPGEQVLLVSHGAAIAILLSQLLTGRCFPFHAYHSSNTGLTELRWGDRYELAYFDLTQHLEALGDAFVPAGID